MESRLKLQIATKGTELAVVSVIAGLLLVAAAGYLYTSPGVQQRSPVEVDNYNIEASLTDSAVVENPNPLYEAGELLETQPAYFLNATPNITFTAGVDGSDNRNVTVTQRLVLEEQALRDGEELWSRERLVAANEETMTGGNLTTNISYNIEELAINQTQIASTLRGVASPTTAFRLETTYETEPVSGESYQGQLDISLTLESTSNAFWFTGERTVSDTERRVEGREPVPQSPNYLQVLLLTLGGIGMGLLGSVIRHKANEYDPHELRIEVYNEEYSEWISEGELVVDPNRQYVYVDSLGDLVDIGIDADKRVIHDRDLRAYVVVDSDLIYYFAREPTNIELWANVGSTTDSDQS